MTENKRNTYPKWIHRGLIERNASNHRKYVARGITDENEPFSLREVGNALNETVDIFLELQQENEKLKQENKRLKEILKIKRKEIINRVLALQEITDKYTNEILFKNNVNPNDAVKQVLKEILSSKVIDDD